MHIVCLTNVQGVDRFGCFFALGRCAPLILLFNSSFLFSFILITEILLIMSA